jgi:metal-responsive CopG/Arc/MetJ family transcriptional regulator
MKTIAITIGEDMLNRIDAIAGANRSRLIREAIGDHLDRIEKVSEEKREGEILKRNRRKLHQEALALIKEQAKP